MGCVRGRVDIAAGGGRWQRLGATPRPLPTSHAPFWISATFRAMSRMISRRHFSASVWSLHSDARKGRRLQHNRLRGSGQASPSLRARTLCVPDGGRRHRPQGLPPATHARGPFSSSSVIVVHLLNIKFAFSRLRAILTAWSGLGGCGRARRRASKRDGRSVGRARSSTACKCPLWCVAIFLARFHVHAGIVHAAPSPR